MHANQATTATRPLAEAFSADPGFIKFTYVIDLASRSFDQPSGFTLEQLVSNMFTILLMRRRGHITSSKNNFVRLHIPKPFTKPAPAQTRPELVHSALSSRAPKNHLSFSRAGGDKRTRTPKRQNLFGVLAFSHFGVLRTVCA